MRIHFLQQWYTYSDPAMEESLHDMSLLQRFTGPDAGIDAIPDESQFGYRKVRDEGLAISQAQVTTLFMLGNLHQARRSLIGVAG